MEVVTQSVMVYFLEVKMRMHDAVIAFKNNILQGFVFYFRRLNEAEAEVVVISGKCVAASGLL